MVARLLNLWGLNLGPEDELLGSNPNNAMGHFEHTVFLAIDDALLNHFGGSWNNPPILNPGWENDPALRYLFEKAEQLIHTFAGKLHWGWKDPRTTLLLPFWKKLLPDIRNVICIRNPLEVARSLEKRDGTSIPAAAHLWHQYMRAAIQNTEGRPRILTFYDDYFREPFDEIYRVVGFCGLDRVEGSSSIHRIISCHLRHQTSRTVELLNEGRVSLECKMFYLGLRSLASEERCAMESYENTNTRIPNGMGDVLSLIDRLHDQEAILQLGTELGDKEQQLSVLRERMNQELMERADQISQLQDHNARLQAFADAVRQTWAYRLYRKVFRPLQGSRVGKQA